MKKNLFIAALAMFAMGANAQVVNTVDGYQQGDRIEKDGIAYELLEVGNGNPVKVLEAIAKEVKVQEAFTITTEPYNVTDFAAGLANMDLDKVEATADEPIAITEAFFTTATYEEAELICPVASISKYAKATGWKLFNLKYTEAGDLLGDINGDHKFSTADVAALKGIIAEDDEDLYNALYDLNGDGKLSTADVAILKGLIAADLF
jgi:hypothetical protein